MLPDGRPYIIMEYLDGAPLSALVEAGVISQMPLPLGGMARLAAEVLDALGAAHAKGIVHRDLKPDNIFVTPSGRPKVLDFGIAKLSDSAPGTGTATGSLLGTPHYMAPEQAAGKPVDHRADLYAMGVILFECATGVKPFTADSLFDLLRKQVESPPPAPRALRPDIPPALEQVILMALAKAPEQRFASAHAMSVALQQATVGLPSGAWAPITLQARTGGPPTPSWPSQAPASWAEQKSLGHQTTVSSGQVTSTSKGPPRAGGSKKGLVIAMLAIVLVGGGVTAAVLASSGGEPEKGSDPISADPVSPPAPPPAKVAEVKEKTAPAPVSRAAAPTPTPTPAPPKPVAKAVAEADDPDDDMASIKSAVAGTPAPSGPDANGWFKRHDVSSPSKDYKKFDVDKHIAWAIAEAKRTVPDAELFRIDIENVFPDGHADLTLPGFAYKYGGVDLRFLSPSHTRRDPSVPKGVSVERMCSLRIDGGPDGFEIRDLGGDCDEITIPPPKCKLAQVWAKALAKHPDKGDYVASIDYRGQGKRPMWWFTIYEDHTSIVSDTYPDDCK
jgi:serine/threonine protein kinase